VTKISTNYYAVEHINIGYLLGAWLYKNVKGLLSLGTGGTLRPFKVSEVYKQWNMKETRDIKLISWVKVQPFTWLTLGVKVDSINDEE